MNKSNKWIIYLIITTILILVFLLRQGIIFPRLFGSFKSKVVHSESDKWAIWGQTTSRWPIDKGVSQAWEIEIEGERTYLEQSYVLIFKGKNSKLGFALSSNLDSTVRLEGQEYILKGYGYEKNINFGKWRENVLRKIEPTKTTFDFSIGSKKIKFNNVECLWLRCHQDELTIFAFESLIWALYNLEYATSSSYNSTWPNKKITINLKSWQSNPNNWPEISEIIKDKNFNLKPIIIKEPKRNDEE
ncbi:MAG: hypothetical protein COA79_22015 [Planctomycetota bacterium]|nr:MAG: hypothetical protein COA79_22015 [Planctomycetota bacterium]